MKKRRVGPLLLVALFIGVGSYTLFQQTRATHFDKALNDLLDKTQQQIMIAANAPDQAPQFFAWVASDGLQKIESLPPAPEEFQQVNRDKLKALFMGCGELYKQAPLDATTNETLQSIFVELQSIQTAVQQARDNPAQF